MSNNKASPELLGVCGLTADSRAVRPGFLFAALPGAKTDGRDFIGAAVALGAAAILAPLDTVWPAGVPPRPFFRNSAPRARLAELAVDFFGKMPARLVAVTGTNGKTSTVDFLRQIFAPTRKAASIGTLGVIAEGFPAPGALTTPDPVTLASTLAALARHGVDDVALEASSHGLDQQRLDGLRFSAAGFTNLTRDHLDYHGDMAAYRAAKLRLFAALVKRGAPVRVMAGLEPETLAAVQEIAAAQKLDFGMVSVEVLAALPEGQEILLQGQRVVLPLPGAFQAENVALAASLASALGCENVVSRLVGLQGVRGRLERAAVLANGAAAYVDYAHTPDAIARLLAALRPHAAGRLIIVFGAGGDRDAGKRPLMGAAAAAGADICIVTDDNPRSEAPGPIRAAILAACSGGIEIGDRRAAIAAGLDMLRAGDVLVVAGKGHEQGQIVGTECLAFDDAQVIRELAA